ncbi:MULTISPECIES: hypothetical protein [Microbacterium]|uniref:hypothetical protein n=1 Tax=Microbacterium TaxID=33882 RepID=UPI001431B494|nr:MULTISPECIES: hypothetical protein [Microbacterium]MCK6065507.1 hypothetical protein [Microbacterium sp. EYE_512]
MTAAEDRRPAGARSDAEPGGAEEIAVARDALRTGAWMPVSHSEREDGGPAD